MIDKGDDVEEQIRASTKATTEEALRHKYRVLEDKFEKYKKDNTKDIKTIQMRRVFGVNVDEGWASPVITEIASELVTNYIPGGAVFGILEMAGTLWFKESVIPKFFNRFEKTEVPVQDDSPE